MHWYAVCRPSVLSKRRAPAPRSRGTTWISIASRRPAFKYCCTTFAPPPSAMSILLSTVAVENEIPALARSRVVYRDGIPVATLEKGAVRWLVEATGAEALEIERVLVRKRVSPALRAYLGRAG